ncbi:enoyl-CoA hydratase-related protein [Sphingomicrobium nitratireducens]|uniref:enoyl-CoA hydratase-related protein n=1 Tax=Sphingomicrobium nitratireducens TaxID=2964666 RepID=UPI00223EFB15|nr:enoyl-CoA hydratase-related protein [Sphingomicrobium nitratireducens]
MSEHVRIERDGAVLAITLARPERRNAITVAMYAALAEAIEGAKGDESVRLITLRGEGQDFTAGNDLMDFMAEMPRDGSDIPVWRFLRALADNEVPILAGVHGNAIGIGTTMLLHCDLVVAERGCRFKMPFTELGLVPEAASSMIIPQLAGRRVAAKVLLLGESFGADEALGYGIASHVADEGGLEAEFDRVKARFLSRPPQSARLTQTLLRKVDRDAVHERMRTENGHFAERLTSDEVREVITAFFAARAKA